MTQPAGWYADPSGLPARRWWDGRQWTDHVQPGGDPIPPPNGYFPPVPPSGPAVPGAHTVAPENPEQAPIFATQQAGTQHGGLPTLTSRPVSPPRHPEVPAAAPEPYAMPPVDAVPDRRRPGRPTPAPPPAPVPARWRRTVAPAALVLVAVLILVLFTIILRG